MWQYLKNCCVANSISTRSFNLSTQVVWQSLIYARESTCYRLVLKKLLPVALKRDVPEVFGWMQKRWRLPIVAAWSAEVDEPAYIGCHILIYKYNYLCNRSLFENVSNTTSSVLEEAIVSLCSSWMRQRNMKINTTFLSRIL